MADQDRMETPGHGHGAAPYDQETPQTARRMHNIQENLEGRLYQSTEETRNAMAHEFAILRQQFEESVALHSHRTEEERSALRLEREALERERAELWSMAHRTAAASSGGAIVTSAVTVKAVGPAALSRYGGKRDDAQVAAWVMDARDRIYEPLLEEMSAYGQTWSEASERAAIRTAVSYLEGDAKEWYTHLSPKPLTFNDLMERLAMKFRPINTSKKARDQLATLQQGTASVEEYANAFDSLCLKIPDIGEADQHDRFVRGLTERVRLEVLLKQPASYEDAVSKALDVDSVLRTGQRRGSNVPGPGALSSAYGPAPMELGSLEKTYDREDGQQSRDRNRSQRGGHREQRKSEYKRKKARSGSFKKDDVCRKCKRKGHWARDCRVKMQDQTGPSNGCIELLTNELVKEPPAERLRIGLIRVNADIGGYAVAAVVDTGATNTFISEEWCEEIGLEPKHEHGEPLMLRLANGKCTPSRGTVDLEMFIPGVGVSRQSAVVHRTHHKLILGLDWLKKNDAQLKIGGLDLLCVETTSGVENNGTPSDSESEGEEEPQGDLCEHAVLHVPASDDCAVCRYAKLRRVRAVRRNIKSRDVRERTPFNDTVSVDLVDPGKVGVCGSRWLVTHVDQGTGWVGVTGMLDKTSEEALRAFKELQRGRGWPRLVRSDEGREFMGVFEESLRESMVAHDTGVPRRANTHATHERHHGDMNASVRAILVQSGLGSDWFTYAARYWALARNLTWRLKGDKTAFERRFGKPWKKSLPVFGSGVIIYRESREKFDPTGQPAIIIGFVVPDANAPKQYINALAVPLDDIRPAAIRKVQEWKRMSEPFPARTLGLRSGGEQMVLEKRAVVDNVSERCSRCEKHIVGDVPVTCDRCVRGRSVKRPHDQGAECAQRRCVCPRDPRGELREFELPRPRQARRPWSSEEDAAIRNGFQKYGTGHWIRIMKENRGVFLAGRKPVDIRARAENMRLIGRWAAVPASPGQANACELVEPRKHPDSENEDHSDLLVTESMEWGRGAHTDAGRRAIEKEFRALMDAGAITIENAIERAVAARQEDARFVKLKGILGIKNAEMPLEFQVTKCRIVAQGCIVKGPGGELTPDDVFDWEKPPGLAAIRSAISLVLLTFGRDAEAAFFDIDAAYLHARMGGRPVFGSLKALLPHLDDVIPARVFDRVKRMSEPVVPLPLALYGMRRSGSDFGAHAREVLKSKQWKECSSDTNIYWRRQHLGRLTVLVLYVDDGCILGQKDDVVDAMKETRSLFRITKDPQYISRSSASNPVRYLGTHVYRSEDGSWVLDSSAYAKHIASRAPSGRSRSTPLSSRIEPGEDRIACSTDNRRVIGQLMWLSRTTRPDLAWAVGHVSRLTDRWDATAEGALEDVLRFMKTNGEISLRYQLPRSSGSNDEEIRVAAYSDSDFHDTPCSTSGGVVFLERHGVRHLTDWGSRRQRRVAVSTAEAEIVALHALVQNQLMPLATFIEETCRRWPRVAVKVDNEAAISVAERGYSSRMVHVSKMQRISIRWLHEVQKDGLARYEHVPTRANLADALTKPLPADVRNAHARAWGMIGTVLARGVAEATTRYDKMTESRTKPEQCMSRG